MSASTPSVEQRAGHAAVPVPCAALDEPFAAGSTLAGAHAVTRGPTLRHLVVHDAGLPASMPDTGRDDAPAASGEALGDAVPEDASPRSDYALEDAAAEDAALNQDGTAATVQQHDVPLRAQSRHSGNRYGQPSDAALVESRRRQRSLEERRARRDEGKLQSTVDDSEAALVFNRPDPRILFAPADLNR